MPGEAIRNAASDARSFIDHRAVELNQAGAGADALPRIVRAGDSPDPDQRQLAAGHAAEAAERIEGESRQRRARQTARFYRGLRLTPDAS